MNGLGTRSWPRLLVGLAGLLAAFASASAWAIDPARLAPLIETSTLTEPAFQERLKRVEANLRKSGAPPLFATRPAVIPLTESATLFTTNAYDASGVPYVGLVVHLLNTTRSPQVLNPATVSLTADGKTFQFKDVPAAIRGYVVDIAGRQVTVEDAVMKRPISLPPGKVTTTLMLFAPVESRGTVPAMTLRMDAAGTPVELDLNRLHSALLEADVTRIGPEGACAVVTIQGAIDGINAGDLAGKLNELNAAGVNRYVLAFGSRSTPPTDTIQNWLDSMSVFGEIGNQIRGLPSLPTEVAELHFTGLPAGTREQREGSRAKDHAEIEEAVVDCLWAAYRRATRRVVLHELEQGDPRGRGAALMCGAHAFVASDLPKLRQWIDDSSRTVRQGACNAIARLDSDESRKGLQTVVREGSPRSAECALSALVSARSAETMAAGIEAARGPTSMSEAALLRIVIGMRHPAFTDMVRQAARTGSKEARLLALPALSNDRSPDVLRIFEEAFASRDREIRDAALSAATAKLNEGDQRLRSIVIAEALKRLRANPSDSAAAEIASRTRDPRFVPPLAARLSSRSLSESERPAIVERLAEIGGAAAMDALVSRFDALTPMEQEVVLGQLWQEDPERALPLAEQLIASSEGSLSERCRQILVHDGSDKSVAALQRAIASGNLPHREELMFALANIGTPAAYEALRDFRDTGNELLRSQAQVAFVIYWQRSPAIEVAETAIMTMDRQIPAAPADVKEALAMFEVAREIDPLLPNVYRGRGNAWMRIGKWKEAARDFEAAMELNPYDDISLTGMVIATVMLDRDVEALEWLAAAKPFFGSSSNYEYNSACAYSRALERRLLQPASPERDAIVNRYRDAAFEHLEQAIDRGFGAREEELPLLERDPDLAALHSDPRFDKAVERVKGR